MANFDKKGLKMLIFMPKEVKPCEGRFSGIPEHVINYAQSGATIYIEKNAGIKSGLSNKGFVANEFFSTDRGSVRLIERPHNKNEFIRMMRPDKHKYEGIIVLKVKELLPEEYYFSHFNLPIISFGHLASNKQLTKHIINSGGTYLSLEDIVENDKRPVLAGMSKIAGEEAVRLGMKFLREKNTGVIIVGYGNVGRAAHTIAAKEFKLPVNILDIDGGNEKSEYAKKLTSVGAQSYLLRRYRLADFEKHFTFMITNVQPLDNKKVEPILLILAPYNPGNKTPVLLTNTVLQNIPNESVIVDVSIDQGGACEFSQVTTLENPVIELERGIKYIGIPNLPGAVPQFSTPIFSQSIYPYIMQIIKSGFAEALKENTGLKNAVSIYKGKVTSAGLAKTFGLEYININSLL